MIRFCIRHRRLVVLLWLVLTAALVTAAVARPGPANDDFTLPGSESQQAADLLGAAADSPPGTLVIAGPAGQAVADLVGRIDGLPGVTVGERRVSPDGSVTAIPLDYPDQATALRIKALRDGFHAPGTTAELSGDDFADFTPGGLAEGLGLLAAAVVLLIAFRSLIATALPLVIGVVGVTCGVASLSVSSHLVDVPSFAVYLTIMLGLGVGIDYALLIVTRFRSSLAEGPAAGGVTRDVTRDFTGDAVDDAVTTAMRTAGRSVAFAGVTVIVTGAGMLFLGPSLGGGIALAAGCGVLMVMLASLTLLPALLRMIGTRIDRFALPARSGGRPPAVRWSRVVQRRPWLTGLLAFALLAGLALPALQLRAGWSDAGDRPVSDTTRRAHDLSARAFGPGLAGPLVLAVADASVPVPDVVERAGRTPGVAAAHPAGERTAIVVPATGPQDQATTDLVHRLRAELPEPVLVTGSTAAAIDFARHAAQRLPWTVGAVLLASFLLLMAVFRSVVLPLKAIAVNLLSIGAAYGVIVAVFQQDVLGLGASGPIDAWVPMTLFVVMFGLSMDYKVFLLSRVREEYERLRDNSRAVAAGLAATARVITAAATIMFCVFAAFGTFDDRALRIMGVGLATAVLVDATVVRLILVPAAMEVLGERNWWFPRLTFSRLPMNRNVT
ncbi:MMPL family transporter [Nonomuraea sp. NN258]|uniref:MMPL family transporter n=1 Tax=Nonomuraea antri TaxID=2730852 RepID=UPI0015698DA4|nr:MMPL family transporter [Nonomuraea antri]NRQ35517.1 MMPL family transporter [Nonomuraea antri]